jgi:homoserine O-acetyltransferase/O-succinyltransferase
MSAVDQDIDIGAFTLDSGEELAGVVQRTTLYPCHPERSERSERSRRTALVTHALTGSSRVAEWWPGMFGENALFDDTWRVVGINVLGGCYGSTGPSDRNGTFPRVTVRDMVRAQALALDALGIERLDLVVGGSLGGMQALQWGIEFPERVGKAVVVGAHDHHSAMGVALNALQREALELDPRRGLRLARKIAMLTYKSEELFNERHGRRPDRHGADRFDVEGYLEHQADLFEQRMDAHTYALLTHAMDAFDVRDAALASGPEFLFVGISSDWLFRPQDVRAAAERFRARGARAAYAEVRSDRGHDAFLAEPRALSEIIARSART